MTTDGFSQELATAERRLIERMGRIEGEIAAGFARIETVLEQATNASADHEGRLRRLEEERVNYQTVTAANATAVVAKRDADTRTRRFYTIGGLVTSVVVPLVVVFLTKALSL